MRKYKLMIAWFIAVIALIANLIHSLQTYTMDIYYFESYLSYILMLGLFSFPLGAVGITIVLLMMSLVSAPIDVANIMTTIVATLVTSLCFYWQWYKLWPRFKTWWDRLFTL